MIKAEELRLGNIIRVGGSSISTCQTYKAHIVRPYTIQAIKEENEEGGDDYILSVFQPVELTPDILEAAGFVRTSINNPFFNMASISISRNREISVHNVGTPNEMIFLSETSDGRSVVVVRNFDYDGKTYLHQLQNLYYCLTGEELHIDITKLNKNNERH